jgi:hypothetical protein
MANEFASVEGILSNSLSAEDLDKVWQVFYGKKLQSV